MIARLLTLVAATTLGACSMVGVRTTEEPKFDPVATIGQIEIRRYGPRIAAEATVDGAEDSARSAGFSKVAGYIFGDNKTKASISMTAPVAQEASAKISMTAPVAQDRVEGGKWRIRFFMPASYTMETLPAPNSPDVTLVTVPPQTLAVLRFTGARDPEAVAEHRRLLLAGLEASAWKPTGEVVAWFYDPPWTLAFLRRNEVAVPVEAR